jgi:hypothetical protein
MTTVLIGMSKTFADQAWLSALALVTSAGITVLSAWDGFFRHRDLWVEKTDSWMSLQNLQSNLQFAKLKTGGSFSPEQVDDFDKRFDRIVMAEWSRRAPDRESARLIRSVGRFVNRATRMRTQ